MTESWMVMETSEPVADGDAAVRLVLEQLEREVHETALTSTAGRMCFLVTNGERAMVVVMDEEGDPGRHAVSPGSEGVSDGYVLGNGQEDEYPDADTISLRDGLEELRALVDGRSTLGAWRSDR